MGGGRCLAWWRERATALKTCVVVSVLLEKGGVTEWGSLCNYVFLTCLVNEKNHTAEIKVWGVWGRGPLILRER